ncbi:hypothetical protein [Solirubrobacter soli]|uniref:hypothetical protein n=1 Tax=Solirubrobacter soli TaxID=363832 RepID=UPI000414AABA|nr:hypothetical protein [Solirubrobacter soli]
MLNAIVVAAAVVAGVTGAWSPCGFSMVETLAPQGYAGRLRTTAIACATFAIGALVGGVVTFGGLALLGRELGANAPFVAAAIALAAAALEARGARILPQVRRQVPESWRRVMPVPLAAGLYGVLLGLGFTTFILSFAVWALAGISVALGDPLTGVLIGLAFGAGRALPVIALAPSNGGSLHAAMAERPRILRSLRFLDALALTVTALALAVTPAQAAVKVTAVGYSDPSVDGAVQALHKPGANGELRGPAGVLPLPGNHPAIGGGRLAYIVGANVVVDGIATIPAAGADALAVSTYWVAWRAAGALYVASLDPTQPATPTAVVLGNVGRPSLAGSILVFEAGGRLETYDLSTGTRTVLRREARAELRGPSVLGGRLFYVRATYKRQQVMTGPFAPGKVSGDRALYGTTPTARRDSGHEAGRFPAEGHINKPLWERPPKGVHDTLTTTAAADTAVYVTRVRQLRGANPTAEILRIDL